MRAGTRTKKIIPVPSPRYHRKHRPFIDKLRILLSSGRGGDGASIMDAQMNHEFAGPIGGNGGQGGSVFLRASHLYPDLHHLKAMGTSITAGAGGKGKDMLGYGNNGRHLVLDVPLGTVLRDADSNQEVADLSTRLNEMVMILEGGIGGKGNAAFKSSVCVSPVSATNGLPGNSVFASIELKTLADVSLVGLPNAGKSSILGAISTCRPEVAAYPFTTLNPFVGKLYSFIGDQTCDIADLPGLVEGAYENRGLGHQFLQHVERSKLICLVVDMNESYCSYDYEMQRRELLRSSNLREEMNNNGTGDLPIFDTKDVLSSALSSSSSSSILSLTPSPVEVVDQLIQELYFYDPQLPPRIACVLCNKMDKKVDDNGVPLSQKFIELKNHVRRKLGKHVECFPVSANIALNAGNPEAMMQQEAEENHINKKQREQSNSVQNNNNNLPYHPSVTFDEEMRRSGLPAAVEFLTKKVFELKKKERDEKERRENIRTAADEELYAEKTRMLASDPADFVDGEDNAEGEEDGGSSSLSPQERQERHRREQEAKQKEALDRLLQMKGKRRNRGVVSGDNGNTTSISKHDQNQQYQGESHQPTTNFTSSKRDFFGKKNSSSSSSSYYSRKGDLHDELTCLMRANNSSSNTNKNSNTTTTNMMNHSSLFDDQFGDLGFADSAGPMKASYGRNYVSRLGEMVTVEDNVVGRFRINTDPARAAKEKHKFGTHSKVPESVTRVAQRATYGRGFGDEDEN